MIKIIGTGSHARLLRLIMPYCTTPDGDDFFLVGIGDNRARKEAFEAEKQRGGIPDAFSMSQDIFSNIGPGTVVLWGAVINHGAQIGKNVIINTGAIIEHDCIIGDHAHISPGAVLCGGVGVGEGAWVGANATVLPKRKIGAWAVVGAGAVVTKDVPAGETWAGNPAGRME